MPGEGSSSPDISSTQPTVVIAQEPQPSRGIFDRLLNREPGPKMQILVKPEVVTNAALTETQRIQKAKELLETPLTPKLTSEQENAIQEAHEVALDEPSAGIYHYTREQLKQKAKILKEAGFKLEQRKILIKSGIVGVLPPDTFDSLDPATLPDRVNIIGAELKNVGEAGMANEVFVAKISDRIDRLIDTGVITDSAEVAQTLRFKTDLQRWFQDATNQVEGPIRRIESTFTKTIDRIEGLQQELPSTVRDQELQEMIVYRDRLLKEASDFELLNSAEEELSGHHYDSRVKVTKSGKEGLEEFEGRGKLQKLMAIKEMANSDWAVINPQALQGDRVFLGEARTRFWVSSTVRAIEQTYVARGHRVVLSQRYGGIVDYVYRKSIDTIYEVVKDRKRYTTSADPYPKDGVFGSDNLNATSIWKCKIKDASGDALVDEEGKEKVAADFDDVREAIEEARRQEPWVPNRQDYETYIKFVADDVEELEEMIPYIVAKVRKKIGTGQANKLSDKLEQEKDKVEGALVNFPTESERQFRRLKSTLAANLNVMGAYYFSSLVREDWSPYLSYMKLLASASQDDEKQDHLVDSLFLDRKGLTMLALEEYSRDDGIFWRYGQKSADTQKKAHNIANFHRWQKRRENDISQILMNSRLKPMSGTTGLLGTHPAFQRLKTEFDLSDAQDPARNNPGFKTRWQEYCEKASHWEETGVFGDPRESERVTFQHPLARSFKAPKKNALGVTEDEFMDMYEPDPDINNKWYASTKRREVRGILEKSERINRAFMQDSTAALAWHTTRAIDPEIIKKGGADLVKEQDRVAKELAEINEYLQAAGMDPIKDGEIVPQKTLIRAVMQALIAEDRTKDPAQRTFKWHYLLTEKLGADLDLPVFAAWYLGAHDTLRPVLLQYIEKDNQPGGLAEAMPAQENGRVIMDEKNTGAEWSERERRMHALTQLVVKAKFGRSGRYFNFPGHDTRGAGVKDIRNWLQLAYGTSTNTTWLNDLTYAMIPDEQDPAKDYGSSRSPFRQLVGLYKGSNEVFFEQSGYGGLIESPRDFEAWVNRTNGSVEKMKALISGDKEGFALLKEGPFSGMFLWRDYSLSSLKEKLKHEVTDPFMVMNNPIAFIEDMQESTYRSGVELGGKTLHPTVKIMKMMAESTYGQNPGAAKFFRTLWWYATSEWMDQSPEYRTKPGYAFDGNLVVARYFMHTSLLEDGGLIYDDKEWDEIMLGYVTKADGTRVTRYEVEIRKGQQATKDEEGNWVSGEVKEGLIDAFPKKLRDEILKGEDREIKDSKGSVVHTVKGYWLPFGLNSKYPETLANYYRDSKAVINDYKGALSQAKPRTVVTRP